MWYSAKAPKNSAPDPRIEEAVRSITDLDRLNDLTERLLDVILPRMRCRSFLPAPAA